MLRRSAIVIIGLALLAGCASQPQQPARQQSSPDLIFEMPLPGQYASDEDFYKARLNDVAQDDLKTSDIPAQARKAIIDCSWLAFQDHLTPEEKAAFEAKARGEQDLPPPIAFSIDRKVVQTFSDKPGDPTSLKAYCPGRAPSLPEEPARIFPDTTP